jgi:hypothetical protein
MWIHCPKQCRGEANAVKHVMRKDLGTHLENDCHNILYIVESRVCILRSQENMTKYAE